MSAVTHTPGPWVHAHGLIKSVSVPGVTKLDSYYASIATVTQRDPRPIYNGGISHETRDANARLICAARALLMLAKQYASECAGCNGTGLVSRSYGGDGYGGRCAAQADADDQPCSECADIRAVIDKAEGRQS